MAAAAAARMRSVAALLLPLAAMTALLWPTSASVVLVWCFCSTLCKSAFPQHCAIENSSFVDGCALHCIRVAGSGILLPLCLRAVASTLGVPFGLSSSSSDSMENSVVKFG
uniref:Secreted protein n=1 Tax=Oryza nivara TaxID=4536 RepID=A0A0E0G4N2_ORYNI